MRKISSGAIDSCVALTEGFLFIDSGSLFIDQGILFIDERQSNSLTRGTLYIDLGT